MTLDLQCFSTEAIVLGRTGNIGFGNYSPFATTSSTGDTRFLKTGRSFFTLKRFSPQLVSACENSLHKLQPIAAS